MAKTVTMLRKNSEGLGMVVHTCRASTRKAEAGGS